MGLPYQPKDMVIEKDAYPDAGPIAYVPEGTFPTVSDQFLIALQEINTILEDPQALQKIKDHWHIDEISTEDLFLLIGVEEAAHRMFFKKKNDRTALTIYEAPTYHSSDQEYRALIWKFAIVKEYFPQYVESFRSFLRKNEQIRDQILVNRKPKEE
jgi:hypothetical protein